MSIESSNVESEVIAAYADAGENLPAEELFVALETRKLDFLSGEFVSRDEAYRIMSKAVGDGYNNFYPELILAFSKDAQIQIARAGSVCLYVLDDPMPSKDFLEADEIELQEDGSYRVWWD